jgi:hypothetical protein
MAFLSEVHSLTSSHCKLRPNTEGWFEGGAFINNVTIRDNVFEFGAGVNPVHASPIDTSDVIQVGNKYLPPRTNGLAIEIERRTALTKHDVPEVGM